MASKTLSVKCPVCGAEEGRRCRDLAGARHSSAVAKDKRVLAESAPPRARPHAARVALAGQTA